MGDKVGHCLDHIILGMELSWCLGSGHDIARTNHVDKVDHAFK